MHYGTVTVAQTSLQAADPLVVRVYTQVGEDLRTVCATSTTEQLQATTLKACTWTVYCYTYARYNPNCDRTKAKFYWGDTAHNCRVQNFQYD